MKRFGFIICSVALLVANCGTAWAQADVSAELLSKIETIRSEQVVDVRRADAKALADSLLTLPPGTVNNDAVMSLASLLSDPDDEVRLSAVHGLSFLGRDAKQAAPAIERAIHDKHDLVHQPRTGPSSIGFYCKTLTIIGQWTLPEDCYYWLAH